MIMSEDNKPGLLAGLLLGAGFTGVFMLPLILIRKLGVSAITLINTIGMTVFAGVQPYLHEWAFPRLQNVQALHAQRKCWQSWLVPYRRGGGGLLR